MSQQLGMFLQQFSSMDTNLLLHRYRAGGLVPQAEAALLSVLESRGYVRDPLDGVTLANLPQLAGHAKAATHQASRPRLGTDAMVQRTKWITLLFWCIALPVVVFFILAAIPLIGNFTVVGTATLLHCSTGENMAHPCNLLGWDMGDFVYGYVVDIFVLGGANPVLAGQGFVAFLRSAPGNVWLLMVGIAWVGRQLSCRQLRQNGWHPATPEPDPETSVRPREVHLGILCLWAVFALGQITTLVPIFRAANSATLALGVSVALWVEILPASLLLVFFTYTIWQGRGWARATYLLLLVIAMALHGLMAKITGSLGISVTMGIRLVLFIFAAYLLFSPSSRAWYAYRKRVAMP